jgi:hypothetical protein
MIKPLGKLQLTKRQMRIWNRRKLELRAAANEFRGEPELAFVADKITALIHGVDADASATLSPFMSSNAEAQGLLRPKGNSDGE